MSDFFRLQVTTKPFLWLTFFVLLLVETLVFHLAYSAAWQNALAHSDSRYWGNVFYVWVSVFLVIALFCTWLIVRLARIRRREKATKIEINNA